MQAKYPGQIELEAIETWQNISNARVLEEFARGLGLDQPVVPLTLIGSSAYAGFQDGDPEIMEHAIRFELGLEDSPPTARRTTTEASFGKKPGSASGEPEGAIALVVLTVTLALVAGLNPCTLYVLLFLLSFIVHSGSRRRILLAGGAYVFYSALIYLLFIAAVLDLYIVLGRVKWLTLGGGALAVLLGALNVKDFLAPGRFGAVGLSAAGRERVLDRLRRTARLPSSLGIIAGAAVLALVANIYAILCTAGIPVAYSSALAAQGLGRAEHNLYLALFSSVYVLPLAVVVIVFAITLGSRKLSDWQGRVLKLVAGTMMLTVGGALLVSPGVLNEPLYALLAIGGAVGVSVLAALVLKSRLAPVAPSDRKPE